MALVKTRCGSSDNSSRGSEFAENIRFGAEAGLANVAEPARGRAFSGSILRRGFSLMELLVVIAVMMILLGLLLPATSSVMKSMSLGRAVALATDEFNYARQTALARNRDVEFRIYRLGSKLDSGNKQYRAFRAFLADGTDPAKSQPLSKLKLLPDNIIIASDPVFSTLLDYANPGRSGLSHGTESLPGGAAEYVSFLFRANGGTSLKPVSPPAGNWYLTMFAENVQTDAATGLPSNYFTAQIDPVTGRQRSYRP